jgi:lipopolysaccharide exporter
VTGRAIQVAGRAFIWQAVQMGGVKIIFLARILVLARLLSPSDFGLVAIATTAMGVLLSMTNFGMLPALVQREQVDDAHYDAAWSIGVSRSLVVTLAMFVAAPLVARLFEEPQATAIVRVLAFKPLLDSLASMKVAALNRDLVFRPLAVLRLLDALVNFVVAVALARVYGVWAMVAGILAGSFLTLALSYVLAPYRPRLSFAADAVRPLIRFGRWVLVTGLITLAGGFLLRVVITRQLGTAALGLYYLAAQLAFLPSEVVSEVVGNVAFPLFARLQQDVAQAQRVFKTLLTGVAALLFPVCVVIIVTAPALVRSVLGPEWQGTEQIIRVLTLVTMVGLFADVAVPVFKGFGQPYRVTALEIGQSSMLVLMGWLLTARLGLPGAALAWLPAVGVSLLLSVFFIFKMLDRPFTGLGRPMVAVAASATASATLAGAVIRLVPGALGVVIGAALAVAAAAALLWLADRRFALGFGQNLAWAFPQIAGVIGALRPQGKAG